MVQASQAWSESPQFSIIVAVYNDWEMLKGCLQSLAQQANAPSFEVVIVDDGSSQNPPELVRNSIPPHQLRLIQQDHSGIPAARNRGIRASKGKVLLFVDADSRLRPNCLAALNAKIAQSPQHDCFQLRLAGNCSSLVGRAEELRLVNFQDHTLQPDGRIRYLNTAGFAIRATMADIDTGLFDHVALRGEDTLLLAKLIEVGDLPLFVPDAVVEHCVAGSLMGALGKDFRSARLERNAYQIIAAKGIEIRITHRERLKLLSSMWKTARRESIGRWAWFALFARQAFKRVLSSYYQYRGRSYSKQTANARQSDVREP